MNFKFKIFVGKPPCLDKSKKKPTTARHFHYGKLKRPQGHFAKNFGKLFDVKVCWVKLWTTYHDLFSGKELSMKLRIGYGDAVGTD